MNPRRLDGGSQELASIIHHNLQGAFPGVEFFLELLDQTGLRVYWRYEVPGAPSEKDVRVYLALNWPSIDAKLSDSDGQASAGRIREMADTASQLAAAPAAIKPKSKSMKQCKHCGSENRRSARACNNCGCPFPQCCVCEKVLQEEDKCCSGCGCTRCSYY